MKCRKILTDSRYKNYSNLTFITTVTAIAQLM